MQVHCKSCGAKIPASDVNLERMVAKCAECDAVFGLQAHVGSSGGGSSGSAPRKRAEVPLPKGILLLRGDDPGRAEPAGYRQSAGPRPDLSLVRRWFQPLQHIPLLFFSVIWGGFLVFWYSMAFQGPAPLIALLFPLIHVTVGVVMFYGALAGVLNRTYIEVDRERIRVRHAPLPWLGNKELPTQDVRQLYCVARTHRTKNGTRTTYNVQVSLHSGRPVDLLTKLPSVDQALFIEQELERALGIEDLPMPGEVS